MGRTKIKLKTAAVAAFALGVVALTAGPASAVEWEIDHADSAAGGSSWEGVYDSPEGTHAADRGRKVSTNVAGTVPR